jgi:ubiquitin-protein ligase E3 C
MNFTGQYRKTRNINLGGKSSTGGASRQSVLQRAQLERERRERLRKEEKAAVRIQSFYRGRVDLYNRRIKERTEWDEEYLSIGRAGSMDVSLDFMQLEDCVRRYSFFERALFRPDDDLCAQRLRVLDLLVQETSLEKVSRRVLSPFVNVNLSGVLKHYVGSRTPDDEASYYALRILSRLKDLCEPEILVDLSRIIKGSELESGSLAEQELWYCTLQISKIQPKVFWVHVLSIPHFYSKMGQVTDDQDIVANIINSTVVDGEQQLDLAGEMDTKGISWILSNFLRLTEHARLSINILAVLNSVLSALYAGLNVKGIRQSDSGQVDDADSDIDDESSDRGEDWADNRDYLRRPLNEFIKDQFVLDCIDKLYTRSFTNKAFSLLSGADHSDESARHVFASFYVTLIKLHPARRKDILLYLSFVSDVSAVHIFWESFKMDSLTYALATDDIMSKQDLESVGERDQQAWVQLVLTLELYSYWLIVADDSEIFEDNSRGLPVAEVHKMAGFLKNITFSFLWHWTELRDTIRASSAPFRRLRDVSLLVMRQIYIRDSRRPFLGNDFWLMTKHFNMSMFISGVVEEQDRLLKQEEGEESDEDVSTTATTRRIKRPAERLKQNVEPRLNILRQVPFFLPFDVRVRIFQEFILRDKERSGIVQDNFFNDFMGPQRVIEIFRGRELEDAFEKIPSSDNLKHKLRISFQTEYGPEPGIDGGGLTKEFLTSVCNEGFDMAKGLFATTQNHLLYPTPVLGVNPAKSGMEESTRDVELAQIEFLGKIIGKCLYDNILVDVEFAPFFLQKSAGVAYKNSFDDLYTLDPEIYNSLVKLRKYPGDVEADLGLNFTIDQDVGNGNQITVELRPDGENIPVTNSNRLEYIHAIANYKLNTVLAPQTNAFFRGMSQLISSNWLKMFNATELQMLISGGSSSIDVNDLKTNTQYGGYSPESETVKHFWEIFQELDDPDKCALIKFVTSVPKAPLGGFQRLEPKFAIRNSGEELDRLPTASTCVNLLKLPNYRSKDLLKQKLLYSIRSNAGFDLS